MMGDTHIPPPPVPLNTLQVISRFLDLVGASGGTAEGVKLAALEIEKHSENVAQHELRVTVHNAREAEHNASVAAFKIDKADVERREKEIAAALADIAAREARVRPWIAWLQRKPMD